MSALTPMAALRRLGEMARHDRAAEVRYRAILADLAPWEHAAGGYGPDAVPYQCRRAAWRLLILAGVL